MNWQQYKSPKAPFGLAELVEHNEDVLNLVFKFYPELDCDWNDKDEAFVVRWRKPVRHVLKVVWEAAEADLGIKNYHEILRLPRKDMAKKLIAANSPYLIAVFNEDLLMEWAGYRKPVMRTDGNVAYLVKHDPIPAKI